MSKVNTSLPTKWQVLSGENKVPRDGIIGRDNLWHRTNIDAIRKNLEIFTNQGELLESIPMIDPEYEPTKYTDKEHNKLIPTIEVLKLENKILPELKQKNDFNSLSQSGGQAKIVDTMLKGRSINVIMLRVLEKEGSEILIKSCELDPGIYVGNVICTVRDEFAHVSVVNCNVEEKKLEKQTVGYEFLTNYAILAENLAIDHAIYNVSFMNNFGNQIRDRSEKIENKLKLGKDLSEEEYDSIIKLCFNIKICFTWKGIS